MPCLGLPTVGNTWTTCPCLTLPSWLLLVLEGLRLLVMMTVIGNRRDECGRSPDSDN